MQTPAVDAVLDRLRRITERDELRMGDHVVLVARDRPGASLVS
jgi:hypothetical protein